MNAVVDALDGLTNKKIAIRTKIILWVKPWIRPRNNNEACRSIIQDLMDFDHSSFNKFICINLPAI
jgi:hypothetical protein